MADDRVAHLVVRRDLPLVLGEKARLLLRAGNHAHDPFLELVLLDDLLAAACCEERCLVHEVRKVRAGEAWRAGCERREIDLGRERLALRVHLEDLLPPDAVGTIDDDLPVEAAWTQQRRVEDVGAVRRGDEDDVVLHLEAVHLDEQLVQRLLALVVAAAEPRAAVTADGVDLVHEDDAGCGLLGLLEEVAHARGADADEHLDEVGAGNGEERDACLACNGAREERLTGARRPVQQHTLRDARAESLELLRVLEELLDLAELLDGLVDAGDVLETDLRRVGRHPLRPRLAEAHHLRAAALHLVHQEDPEPEQEDEGQERGEDRPPGRRADALRVEVDLVGEHGLLERGFRLGRRVVDAVLLAVGARERDRLLIRVDRDERAGEERRVLLNLLVDPARALGGRLLPAAAQGLQGQPDQRCDDDQREKRATEESIQTRPHPAGYLTRVASTVFRSFGLRPFRDEIRVEHAHVRQVSVALGEIEAVADHEPIRDLEAHVADGHVDLPALRFCQKRADLEARGLARLQIAHQIGQSQTRVDDVLDDEDVPALDIDVQVLENPDNSRGIRRVAVARDGHEVDLAWDRQLPHEIGHEENGALEDAHEEQVAARIVGGDLLAELGHAALEHIPLDQRLRDRLLELGRTHRCCSGAGRAGASAAWPAPLSLRGLRKLLRHTADLYLGMLDEPGHRDDRVAAHDERPRFALGLGDLRVDEHVLDLLRAPGEPVTGLPASYPKASELGADAPPAPRHLVVEIDRAALEPEPLVLTHRLNTAAEVNALRPGGRREKLGERRRQGLPQVERSKDVRVRRRMEAPEERQDLVSDQTALRVGIRRVRPKR